ncbi:ABC transporter substrate-binding protein [Rhizohabitans arisaemae]|uniref:ABC transporter substrate-binding protein n=1 Tax=Rhizohabitans arisaemae TaxID=2720610 RepID=UPI0024B27728|nr:ABC transporter substrate-binding protein [Rhizohabitans arisaemae]
MRKLVIHLAVVLLATAGAGCAPASSESNAGRGEPETLELRYQGSVGTVTFPELAQDLGYLGDIKLNWIGNTISGPQDIQAVATGDADFGGAFNGAIVKLVAAKAPIKAVVGYYGSDKNTFQGYYTLDSSPIESARDLIGKKIGMNTLGAHAEAVLKEYLRRGGLTPEEIKQVQPVVVPPVNVEQSLRQRQIDVAVLGGVLRDKAVERGGLRLLFSDFALFGPFTAGSIVLTDRFIARNPTTARKFVEGVAKAVEWTQTHDREEVVARFKKIVQNRGRNEDPSLVGYWRSSGVAGRGGAIAEAEFATWVRWLEAEGEIEPGRVRPGEVFTNALNPLAGGAR